MRGGIVAAVLGALALEFSIDVFTSLFPGDVSELGSLYGAPLPVGTSCGFCVVSLGGSNTFSWPAFSANVAATAVVVWLLIRATGHTVLVPLGGMIFLIVTVLMYLGLSSGLPFAGLPVPVALRQPLVPYPRVQLLALWLDCIAGAALFGFVGLRRDRGMRVRTAE